MPFCAAFLTEVCDTDLLSSRRLGKKHSSKDSTEGRALEVYMYSILDLSLMNPLIQQYVIMIDCNSVIPYIVTGVSRDRCRQKYCAISRNLGASTFAGFSHKEYIATGA